MQFFLYSAKIEGKAEDIQKMMNEFFSTEQLDIFRSINNVAQKLKEPWEKKPIVVILIYKKDELLDFVSIREQLHSVRLILILPDAEKGMISLAHRLRPNYLTYIDRDIQELKSVLQKMLTST